VSACVCLFAHVSPKLHGRTFHILCACYPLPWLVHGIPIRYVLPVLWMTSCFVNNGPCGIVTLWQQSRCNVMYFLTLHWCMVLTSCTKTRGAVQARAARGKICDAPLPCLCTFLIDLSNAVPFAWRFFSCRKYLLTTMYYRRRPSTPIQLVLSPRPSIHRFPTNIQFVSLNAQRVIRRGICRPRPRSALYVWSLHWPSVLVFLRWPRLVEGYKHPSLMSCFSTFTLGGARGLRRVYQKNFVGYLFKCAVFDVEPTHNH